MKVVIVNNLYAPNMRGGAERSVQLLAEGLVRTGVEATVVCIDEVARETAELNGVKVVTLGVANVYWPFGEASPSTLWRKLWHLVDLYNPVMERRVVEVLKTERPDIVHTNNLQGMSVAPWRAAALLRRPVLHTLRDYYLTCARATRFRDGKNCATACSECRLFCAARRRLSAGVDAVVGSSRFILAHHTTLGFFPGASIRTAIDNAAISFRPPPPPHKPMVFGCLGRLESFKGVDLVIDAFAQRDDDWELLIAGVGPDEVVAGLKKQAAAARRPEQIRFLGWTDSDAFMRRVDVLVIPSLWNEPLSRATIEAQSNGVAVIATRRGGLPEIVDDESTGLLFEPGERGGLTQAIDRMLGDPTLARRLGEAAREAAERFRPERVVAQYAQAYADTIRTRS